MHFNFQTLDGYAYGATQPSAFINFKTLEFEKTKLCYFLEYAIDQNKFNDPSFQMSRTSLNTLNDASLVISALDILSRYCGDLRFTPIQAIGNKINPIFVIPTLSPLFIRFLLKKLIDFLSKTEFFQSEQSFLFLEEIKKAAKSFFPQGTNVGKFLLAASKLNIPFRILSNQHVVLNYGRSSIILNSSIIDHESSIGVSLSKSKVDTNSLLKLSGFPVAEQARIYNFSQAHAFAEKVGFPVVIKPENQEQGRGVYAYILDKDELEYCFNETHSKYNRTIIEKFIPGDIYRVNVFDGKVIRVVKRSTAMVRGDGTSTTEQLIKRLNDDPRRKDPYSPMKIIPIDDEILKTLEKQGHSVKSVPSKNEKVILSFVSSVSRGGDIEDFKDNFHRDNVQLCIDVTKTMRLYLSGIDFISVDGSVPWYKNQAVICEVNAQPQLGWEQNTYDFFIKSIIKDIPKIHITISNNNISSIDIFNKTKDFFDLTLSPLSVLRSGLPTQYFDKITIADDVHRDIRDRLKPLLISKKPTYF